MTENNYIMLNLEDEKSARIAEVMANKTCKKILSILAEQELSESDIAKELGLPLNTVEYNLNKLISSGLVEKASKHFWSVKGKKIPVYKLANKYIVIAPKASSRILKNFLPVVLLSGIGALIIRQLTLPKNLFQAGEKAILAAPLASGAVNLVSSTSLLDKILSLPSWEWFLAGALFAILIFLILTIVRGKKQ